MPIGDTSLWEIACRKVNALPPQYGKYVLCEANTPLERIAREYPNLTVIIRSPESASIDEPNSKIFADLEQVQEDYLMFLNPCLLFLTESTITKALDYFSTQCIQESLSSVKPFKNWLYYKGELMTDVNKKSWSTKEIEGYMQAAHCFHIFSKRLLFEENKMLDEEHDMFLVPIQETIDVDTELEYDVARYLYEKGHRV